MGGFPHNGEKIGRFVVGRKLGVGGMGAVYLAKDTMLDVVVALKFLSANLDDAESEARFKRELLHARQVAHPGICRLFDIHDDGDYLFLSMEYVEGPTLQALIRDNGILPGGWALDIITASASAIAAAHAIDIVHRDLKPGNIIVRGHQRISVLDFGLSKALGARSLTAAGVAMGTYYYMAPEIVRGETASHRTDVYALGVILYECITGRVPFEASAIPELQAAIVRGQWIPPTQFVDAIPAGVEDVLRCAMAVEPAGRFASAAQLHAALVDLTPNPLGGEDPSARDSLNQTLTDLDVPGSSPGVSTSTERWPQEGLGQSKDEPPTEQRERITVSSPAPNALAMLAPSQATITDGPITPEPSSSLSTRALEGTHASDKKKPVLPAVNQTPGSSSLALSSQYEDACEPGPQAARVSSPRPASRRPILFVASLSFGVILGLIAIRTFGTSASSRRGKNPLNAAHTKDTPPERAPSLAVPIPVDKPLPSAPVRRDAAVADAHSAVRRPKEAGAPGLRDQPPPPGPANTRAESHLTRRLRQKMRRRGLIEGDDPVLDRLLRKALQAAGQNQRARAKALALQVQQRLQTIAIDRSFISRKLMRFNQRFDQAPESTGRRRAAALGARVLSSFERRQYVEANRFLNQAFIQLQAGSGR